MSPVPSDQQRSYLARQVGTLALSRVSYANPMALTRAASWHNHLHRLGVRLPLVVVHDLGLLLTVGIAPATGELAGGQSGELGGAELGGSELANQVPQAQPILAAYQELLAQLAESEVMQTAASMRVRDELVAVILHKLLHDLQLRWPARNKWIGAQELPLDPGIYLNLDVAAHFRNFDPLPVLALLGFLAEHRLHLLTAVEQIDLDTLRLLGLFGSGDQIGGLVDVADLLAVFSSPESNDVVNFSMDLIPSVLETKRAAGVQVFSIDGYVGIERQGSIDSVVLSEFAFDRDIFEQKVIDNELYYYSHEKHRADERRLQYVLVDSSASMRGVRQVFARGLALTLTKKFSLKGDEVWLRFFDSRLYEVIRMEERKEASVPYLLCFRSERGRNYGRVFHQLAAELEQLRRRHGRPVVLYIITHGECHISTELVSRLRRLAFLYGIFILPSSTLHLDYLSLLQRHQIVTPEALSSRERSVDRALEIVDDAAGEAVEYGRRGSGHDGQAQATRPGTSEP